MLEWVCPRCDRAVDPGFEVCPFCRDAEATGARSDGAKGPAETQAAPVESPAWDLADRVFRMLMGFVAVAALVYFLAFLWAYYSGNDAWLAWLTRWLFWRRR